MYNVPDPRNAEFLLRCLSLGREQLAVSRQPSADWNAVVDLACNQGLAPLLFRRLKESDARTSVSADAWKRLRRVYFDSAGANTRLYRELGPVLRALRNSGIPVTPLKGTFLADAVYGDVALRPMGDVDLLVRESDLERAQKVLLDMGGVHQQFEDIESSSELKRHLPQIRIGHLVVEIHWTIVPPAGPVRVDVAGLWNRACPYSLSGVEILAPALEDLLLHLCLHACYQNHLAEFLNLCDITETARRFGGRLDWEGVARRAGAWGASRYVALALHMARNLLGAEVPDKALDLLVPGGLDRRVLEAAKRSVLTQSGYGQWLPFFDGVYVTTLGDRARLSWKRVFLSRSEMAATYPGFRSALLPWFYARRVGHVVASYMTHTLRRARLMATSHEREDNTALVKWLAGKN